MFRSKMLLALFAACLSLSAAAQTAADTLQVMPGVTFSATSPRSFTVVLLNGSTADVYATPTTGAYAVGTPQGPNLVVEVGAPLFNAKSDSTGIIMSTSGLFVAPTNGMRGLRRMPDNRRRKK